ncbi:MAG: GTPase RsgA [Bacilli bacterium]|jgi:ribosome biogenesis GTPase YqeH|nr:GTPase RsgA [Bacilli bacterium]
MRQKVTLTSQIRIQRCSDCGAILQSEDPSSPGYLSQERVIKKQDQGLCDRCYNLRHYNSPGDPEFGADYIKILKKATTSGALVVYVLDLFTLESSFVPEIGAYLGKNVLVVLNKRDVLPKDEDDNKLIGDAKKRLVLEHIVPTGVMVTSSAKNINIDAFLKEINALRNGKDVYFIGASSVGKSSLVNSILRRYKNETDRVIQTLKVEGTRLEVMEIPLDQESSIFDTPGIYNPKSLLNQVERAAWKYLVPREEIAPRVYLSQPNQAFVFGGVAAFELVSGGKTEFTFAFSNEVAITRTKALNLEKTFASLAQTDQVKPTSAYIKSLSDLEKKEIAIPASGKMELSLFGLGKITFSGANQRIAIYLPPHVGVKAIVTDPDFN